MDLNLDSFHEFFFSVEMVKIYASDHLYDEFVVTSSGLLLLAGENHFPDENQQVDRPLEQILFEATLVDDARHITILWDIWTLFLRYYAHIFHAY